ncbi:MULTISPECIES: heavy-metal-associated domain-containing protein [unclassified Corynebacterium]|uniref:heavy-metal-associated domain-containing protein n=1 Tax=unclassified Corynebacterium TaxID=2624378 RepID=UPI0029C9FBF7|nr:MULTISPECIES: heavy-metal-associated domain-containing protein [unclassified Corynebacterium]WPF67035.1 heavy-metal-associated domain-containing protein [Corynebacterium sp. 22KM0430]WPF69523.1 heavy-metal-associated domain-containing protein [Corynebacterium sp. 21KM1197]
MITTYDVTGMTCSHCENAVREEVSALPNLSVTQVSAEQGTLVIESAAPLDESADAAVREAVAEAGYSASRAAAR